MHEVIPINFLKLDIDDMLAVLKEAIPPTEKYPVIRNICVAFDITNISRNGNGNYIVFMTYTFFEHGTKTMHYNSSCVIPDEDFMSELSAIKERILGSFIKSEKQFYAALNFDFRMFIYEHPNNVLKCFEKLAFVSRIYSYFNKPVDDLWTPFVNQFASALYSASYAYTTIHSGITDLLSKLQTVCPTLVYADNEGYVLFGRENMLGIETIVVIARRTDTNYDFGYKSDISYKRAVIIRDMVTG